MPVIISCSPTLIVSSYSILGALKRNGSIIVFHAAVPQIQKLGIETANLFEFIDK
jgi:hypothetical protein